MKAILFCALILTVSCGLESDRSYIMAPNVEIGQTWTRTDTVNPFERRFDTLTVLDVKREYAWVKYNNRTEMSMESHNIRRFWRYYKPKNRNHEN